MCENFKNLQKKIFFSLCFLFRCIYIYIQISFIFSD